MKTTVGLLFLLIGGTIFAAGRSDTGKISIAGIMMQADIEWFKYVEQGMRDAAAKDGVDFVAGNANMEVTTESSLVDTYSSQGKKAILVSALDPVASAPALERAKKKGVVVVNYNTEVNSGQDYFVGVDNYQLGNQMGKRVAEYYQQNFPGKKIKGAMITINMFAQGKDRMKGFLDGLKGDPNIEIVGGQDANGPEKASAVTETLIQANPDLDFIWSANEGGAIGAQVGVRAKGKIGEILVFATDMSITIAKELLDPNGAIAAVSTQDPYQIGYQSLDLAVKVIKGEQVPERTIVPLDFFSKQDLQKVKDYLNHFEGIIKG